MNLKEESQNPNLFHADNVTKVRKRKGKKPMQKVSQKRQRPKVGEMDLGQYITYNFSLNMVSTVVFNKVTYFIYLIDCQYR